MVHSTPSETFQASTRHSDPTFSHGSATDPNQPPHPEPATAEDPWQIDEFPEPPEDCVCETPRPSRPRPPAPEPRKPKNDDCCRQILEALKCIPNIDPDCLKFHKPKASPKFKVAELCGALPMKNRLAPMMLLVLRRFRAGVAPLDPFETRMQAFLGSLPPKQLAALEAAQDGYDKLPAARRDCVFDTRFDAWSDDKPLNPDFFARNLVGEIIAYARFWRFGPNALPTPAVGTPRPWERTFLVPGGEPGRTEKVTAPWPWICAISPVARKAAGLETDWFRNESQLVPGNLPRGSVTYKTHEFAWTCGAPSPGGAVSCSIGEPIGPGSGGFGFAECSGGLDYRVFDKSVAKQVCLTVPQVEHGSEVGLRGLNFFSPRAKVHIRKVDGPPFRAIPPISLSDWQPDTEAAPGAAATCGDVRDHAYFIMPGTVRDGLNDIAIPPGRYAITLVVPNDVNYAPVAGGSPPADFASNEILVELQPSASQRYQILTDEAFCDEETNGPGSDEPWFTGFVATAEPANADTTIQFPFQNRVQIMQADDVDSGEAISFGPVSLFQDALGRKAVAVALLGLEVDSESAAREQIDDFAEAYFAYWKEWYAAIGGGASAGIFGAAVEQAIQHGAALSWMGWAAGIVFVVIMVIGLFYSAWAPADPIAIDIMAFNSRKLYDLTDANLATVPEPDWLRLAQLRMVSEPLGKVPVAGGASSVYSERRHYESKHEDSRYSLTFRFKRI